MKKTFLLFAIIFAISCTPPKDLTDPQVIVNESIAFHRLESLGNSKFSLTFRDLEYTYQNQNGLYEYTRTQTDSTGAIIYDVLNNDGLIRYIDGKEAEITEERRGAYARSVNSVIYFFRLPYGLNDGAVNKKRLEDVTIKGKKYYKIEVTFDQEGGGVDFEDVFVYWISKEDFHID